MRVYKRFRRSIGVQSTFLINDLTYNLLPREDHTDKLLSRREFVNWQAGVMV
jgi:hypothetical protein